MRTYLSFGGGVNSVAMYLLLMDEGIVPGDPVNGFEAIYIDHGCDWPQTREYVAMFAEKWPLTILTPEVDGYSNLYEYAFHYRMIPSRRKRWCTDKFKVRVINAYIEKPCFSLIGFASEEAHRAAISTENGVENRFPLIERDIDRGGCARIIQAHGVPVPMKSGCYFCPFQRKAQWRQLRREHPDLFCKVRSLENNEIEARKERGKGPLYLTKKPIDEVLKGQMKIFEKPYPPCQCGL